MPLGLRHAIVICGRRDRNCMSARPAPRRAGAPAAATVRASFCGRMLSRAREIRKALPEQHSGRPGADRRGASMPITRRSFGLAALGGAVVSAAPALAKAPLAGAQVPGVYRLKVGAFQVT